MKRKRGIEIKIRLSQDECDHLAAKMEYVNSKNREEFIRNLIMTGYNIKVDSSEIRQYVRLIGNIAHNVNQIARRTNETRNFYESDLIDLQHLCNEVLVVVKESLNVQYRQLDKIKTLIER
jgi:hypothetical protein